MDFNQVFQLYLDEIQPSPSVKTALKWSWPQFADYCRGEGLNSPKEVAPCHVEAYQRFLLWEPGTHGQLYKPNTVDQFLRRVRQVLRWAKAKALLKVDPTRCLLLPRPLQPRRNLLTRAELQTLLTTPDQSQPQGLRDTALFALVSETDLGLYQCLALKTGQERELTLETATRRLLETYLAKGRPAHLRSTEETALFLNFLGGPLSAQSASIQLRTLGRSMGIDHVTFRLLRRSHQAHLEQCSRSRHFPLTETLN